MEHGCSLQNQEKGELLSAISECLLLFVNLANLRNVPNASDFLDTPTTFKLHVQSGKPLLIDMS